MTTILHWILIVALAAFPLSESPERELEVISFADFEQMVGEKSDKLRIYNFWATWCAPCVKEMPYFEKAAALNPDLELVFISMDDGRNPDRVSAFIKKRKITSPVFLLDDVDYNKWIDRVDTSWSGAIPATLFVQSDGGRYFHEGELDEPALIELIQNLTEKP